MLLNIFSLEFYFWSLGKKIESKKQLQVSLVASHPIPNQLLTIYALLGLHLRHTGQIFRRSVSKISRKRRRCCWRGPSDSSHNSWIHLSPTSRICRAGIQTSHIHVVSVLAVPNHKAADVDVCPYGRTFVVESNQFEKLKMQTASSPSLTFRWQIPSHWFCFLTKLKILSI